MSGWAADTNLLQESRELVHEAAVIKQLHAGLEEEDTEESADNIALQDWDSDQTKPTVIAPLQQGLELYDSAADTTPQQGSLEMDGLASVTIPGESWPSS